MTGNYRGLSYPSELTHGRLVKTAPGNSGRLALVVEHVVGDPLGSVNLWQLLDELAGLVPDLDAALSTGCSFSSENPVAPITLPLGHLFGAVPPSDWPAVLTELADLHHPTTGGTTADERILRRLAGAAKELQTQAGDGPAERFLVHLARHAVQELWTEGEDVWFWTTAYRKGLPVLGLADAALSAQAQLAQFASHRARVGAVQAFQLIEERLGEYEQSFARHRTLSRRLAAWRSDLARQHALADLALDFGAWRDLVKKPGLRWLKQLARLPRSARDTAFDPALAEALPEFLAPARSMYQILDRELEAFQASLGQISRCPQLRKVLLPIPGWFSSGIVETLGELGWEVACYQHHVGGTPHAGHLHPKVIARGIAATATPNRGSNADFWSVAFPAEQGGDDHLPDAPPADGGGHTVGGGPVQGEEPSQGAQEVFLALVNSDPRYCLTKYPFLLRSIWELAASLLTRELSRPVESGGAYPADHVAFIAEHLRSLGDFEPGLRLVEAALARDAAAGRARHPWLAALCGRIHADTGNPAGALDYLVEAETALKQITSVPSAQIAACHYWKSRVLLVLGKPEEARQEVLLGLLIHRRRRDACGRSTGYCYLAAVLRQQSKLTRARKWLERSLRIDEKTLPPQHPDLAFNYAEHGLVAWAQGDLLSARSWLASAVELQTRRLPLDSRTVATNRLRLGLVEHRLGNLYRAQFLIRRAYKDLGAALPPGHADREQARQWLHDYHPAALGPEAAGAGRRSLGAGRRKAAPRPLDKREEKAYPLAAFRFVYRGIAYWLGLQKSLEQPAPGTRQTVQPGDFLLPILRDYALLNLGEQAGPALSRWGLSQTADFFEVANGLQQDLNLRVEGREFDFAVAFPRPGYDGPFEQLPRLSHARRPADACASCGSVCPGDLLLFVECDDFDSPCWPGAPRLRLCPDCAERVLPVFPRRYSPCQPDSPGPAPTLEPGARDTLDAATGQRLDARRYVPAGFAFVLEGLAGLQPRGGALSPAKAKPAHVSGQTLCLALRDLAQQRFGRDARPALRRFGMRSTRDFGDYVFALVAIERLVRRPRDRIQDFDGVFSFSQAFRGG